MRSGIATSSSEAHAEVLESLISATALVSWLVDRESIWRLLEKVLLLRAFAEELDVDLVKVRLNEIRDANLPIHGLSCLRACQISPASRVTRRLTV